MKRISAALLAALALAVVAAPPAGAEFGFTSFDVTYYAEEGGPAVSEAGAHRFEQATTYEFGTRPNPIPGAIPDVIPGGPIKDQIFSQIVGLVGNPTAVGTCRAIEFAVNACPLPSQIGWGRVQIGFVEAPPFPVLIHNLAPRPGVAALIGFDIGGTKIYIEATLNPRPPHNLIAAVRYTPQTVDLFASEITLWGVPADPANDDMRGSCLGGPPDDKCPAGVPEEPFLTLPRACAGPLPTSYEINAWTDPETWLTGSSLSHDELGAPLGFTDCESLAFSPQVGAAPTTNRAESPSGFDFSVQIDDPGISDPDVRAGSDLKKAVVTLPEGIAVNPASANGLDACSEEELARESATSSPGDGCPNASKLATVQVTTPLLKEQLRGSIFLAEPHRNPLGTLLAGYLVIKQPERGIFVALPGKIETDPQTGQITASFDQNPQAPFSDLEVSFPGGPHAPLITPPTCGSYSIQTELYPWSGNPPHVEADAFEVTQAPGSGNCPTSAGALPHAPSFDAGTVEPLAGHYSPFVVNLRREDGSQRFAALTTTTPPGLAAKLAGTPYCPDGALAVAAARPGKAEQAEPACPAVSRVGSFYAATGAGPNPYWASGSAYLAGPYKGAPLSLAVVVPAVAGPFDLGTVVTRIALNVDPQTAKITAVSDPFPTILEGIPLDVRTATLRLDKPEFTLNPTSCDPMAIGGQVVSTLGAVAPLNSRFQLGECGRLRFRPKLALALKGGTKRGDNPKLIATLTAKPGEAGIAGTAVKLPPSAFLDQAHIRTICTRVQWAQDACPKGSIYGRASARSPLLDYTLAGNVYLRSSDNKLPDMVVDLRGPAHQPLRIELVGRTDSVKGALRNTFDLVPDAPVQSFRLELFGGKRGLVVNSRDICARAYRAEVRLTAHNGARKTLTPAVRNAACKKQGKGAKRRGKRAG